MLASAQKMVWRFAPDPRLHALNTRRKQRALSHPRVACDQHPSAIHRPIEQSPVDLCEHILASDEIPVAASLPAKVDDLLRRHAAMLPRTAPLEPPSRPIAGPI